MKRLQSLVFYCTLFLVPSNLFKVFYENSAYVHGIFVDYLLPKAYLSDLFMVVFCALVLIESPRRVFTVFSFFKKHTLITLALTTLVVYTTFFVNRPLAAGAYLAHVGLILAFFSAAAAVGFRKKTMQSMFVLAAAVLAQILLGLFQYQTQHELVGYLLLGEPRLSALGVSHTIQAGVERITPYGTTAHPNVLGGFLALGSLLLLTHESKRTEHSKARIFCLSLVALLAGVVLTFTGSLSAILAYATGLCVLFVFVPIKRKLSVSLPHFLALVVVTSCLTALALQIASGYLQTDSVERRVRLQDAAFVMIVHKPLFGVGANTFTAELENYAYSPEIVRFVQPVHMVFLLFVSETGAVGVILLGAILNTLKSSLRFHPVILALIPIAVLDHYLISLQTGLLLLGVVFFFTLEEKPTERELE